jgi:hypothetical protein
MIPKCWHFVMLSPPSSNSQTHRSRSTRSGVCGPRNLEPNLSCHRLIGKRPLTVSGIEDFITRADLLERSLLIRHPPIPEEKRRPESKFWAAFDAAYPKVLGEVLDRVSAGLRELPRVKLTRLPRMADFALFAIACERGGGEETRFLSAYTENQAGAHEQALDVHRSRSGGEIVARTSKFDAALLAAIRKERDRLRVVDLFQLPSNRMVAGQIRVAVNDAKAGIVAADFAVLLGRELSGAELKACQRGAARLEASGKLERLRLGYYGVRFTHLRLIETQTCVTPSRTNPGEVTNRTDLRLERR